MGDWRDHVVPDWVADEYNKHVPSDERIPGSSTVDKDYFDVDSSLSQNYVERHNSSSGNSNNYSKPLNTYYDFQAERRTSFRSDDNEVGKLAVFLLIVFWFIGMYFFTWLLS